MKVLQINSVCGIGSTGRIATDIHNTLTKLGHESYVAYGREVAKNCDNVIKIGNKTDNYLHVAKTRTFDRHGFGSKEPTKIFINKMESLDPDIFHLHNIHGYYIHVGLLFKYLKSKNKPIVWTLHDCWPFTGHCVYFDFVNCPRWKTGCYECPQKSTYPSSLMLDKSNKNFFDKKEIFTGVKNMTIITPSKWLADLVKESFLGNYKVKVINNGIDLDLFKPTESIFRKKYKLENKFVILGVASPWSKRKGFESFIQLAKYLSEDERIVMVGLTEKQIKHLPSNIIGINRTDSVQELAEIYSMADVFVNPTLEDNFPTTNLESLACGTPVITFNTGGSVEAIREEKTGYIVKKGRHKGSPKKVEKIKSDGKEFYFQNCVDRANGLYDKNVKYHEYIEYYNSLLKV